MEEEEEAPEKWCEDVENPKGWKWTECSGSSIELSKKYTESELTKLFQERPKEVSNPVESIRAYNQNSMEPRKWWTEGSSGLEFTFPQLTKKALERKFTLFPKMEPSKAMAKYLSCFAMALNIRKKGSEETIEQARDECCHKEGIDLLTLSPSPTQWTCQFEKSPIEEYPPIIQKLTSGNVLEEAKNRAKTLQWEKKQRFVVTCTDEAQNEVSESFLK